ncbi:MAG TPA: hypothetical protein PLN52_00800 [Opitutaceae bacterium]|nr:hypothetical protein [Opitutaceae bacterium]
MPHDPHAEFDHHVLEMIERSPIGAAPSTPAHQESINRLRTSHQIYSDADHKNGYVTARSLSTRPSFVAQNLDQFVEGKIAPESLESNASIFDRYVASLPLTLRAHAETFRARVAGRPAHHRKHGGVIAHDPVHSLLLVPGSGPHPGVTGNYLYGSLLQLTPDSVSSTWSVHLHDSDDGWTVCDLPTLAEAYTKVQELLSLAPFHMSEIESLGFQLK